MAASERVGKVKGAWLHLISRTLNKATSRAALSGRGPFTLIEHQGRRSGRTYRTPVIAGRAPAGVVVELTYGPQVQWYRNVVAAGGCVVGRGGHRWRGGGPRPPAEGGFRRGAPVGTREEKIRGPPPRGRPHDDNAAYLGGAAGHAGLFAPAAEAWAIAADWASAWLNGRGLVFQRTALAEFLRPGRTGAGPGRPLGFNIKSQAEALTSSAWPEQAVGHLGYTGVSLWWEPESGFIWLLLTNRVHPRAVNPAWRPAAYVGGPITSGLCR
ncbi:MAG: serine hydrolase [Promicromonosporaceae bacterium]|nr:serine hydrolase [Promicromonosporaceae bacterium]